MSSDPEIEWRLAIMEAKTLRDVGIVLLGAVFTGTTVALVLDTEAALGNLLAGGILLWLLGGGVVGFLVLRFWCLRKARTAMMALRQLKQDQASVRL